MSRYGDLVELEVDHAFAGDGPCRALHFELDAASRALSDRAGLLVKGTGGALRVLYDESRTGVLAGLAAEGALVLAWRVRSTDPSLAACSEPPLLQPGRVLCLESSDARSPLMHDDEHVTEADLVAVTDVRLPALLAARDRGEREAETELVALLGTGLAALLTPRDLLLPPLAFVVVRIDTLEPRRHRIRLDALRSHWRYRVLGDLSESDVAVIDADGKIAFESLGTLEILGGRSAATFLSSVPLPLHARGGPRFGLHAEGAGRRRTLVERLPLASVANTRRETVDGAERRVSDIYVNL